MTWSRPVPFLVGLVIIAAAPPACEAAKGNGRLIVLDVTEKGESQNRAYMFDATATLSGWPGALRDYLEKHVGQPSDSTDFLLARIRKDGGLPTRRWLSKRGDSALVFVFRPQNYVLDLKIDEKGRQTQLGSDIATLFKAIAVKGNILEDSDKTVVSKASWKLEKSRASLTIQAAPSQTQKVIAGLQSLAYVGLMHWNDLNGLGISQSLSPTNTQLHPTGQAQDATQAADTTLQTAAITITTGPTEHWYLSTSVPLSSIKELQYVDSTGTFEPRDKPKRFLVGANFLMGDILSDKHSLIGGLAPGVFVEASSKPFESFGLSVSYRLPAWNASGVELDLITPFWGLIRTENDSRSESGSVKIDEHVVFKGAWGISLNLDKVASWLSGK